MGNRETIFRQYSRTAITRSFSDHDEYLVAVFTGNPDIQYRGCTWVPCGIDYPDNEPLGMRFESVFIGTRSDSMVNNFLTASGYDTDGRRRTHYGPEFNHTRIPQSNMAAKYRNTRTLLQIFSSIKKNYPKLIKNPNAYSWKWLTIKTNEIIAKESRRLDSPRVIDENNPRISDRLLNALSNYVGHEFVFVNTTYLTYKMWPKELCNSYLVAQEVRKWVPITEWNTLKDTSRIKQCSISNEWFWYGLMHEYRKRINPKDKKPLYKTLPFGNIPFNMAHIQTCMQCATFYEKTELKEHPLLEQLLCPPCSSKPILNPKVRVGDAMGGYHSHREWKFLINRKDEKDTGITMGLEVEMHSKLGKDVSWAQKCAWQILQKQWDHNPKWNEAYFERDGSLEEGGLEMVTNPMALEYARDYWTVMLPHLRKVCTGWNTENYIAGPGNYGIHITFDRKHFGDYRLARFVKFCDMKENQWFMRGIAQRKAIYGRGGTDEICSGNFEKLQERIMVKDKKILSGIQRYQPLNIKGDGKLVEIRFFRTTLNTESFLKNIEFVHAMNVWCKTTAFSVRHIDFCNWLLQTLWCHKKYPNLIGYLSREKLPVKGVGSVKNTLHNLFNDKKIDKLNIVNLKNVTEDVILSEDLEPCA